MIKVTRLNERKIVVNAELIKVIESTPDTLITLINGESFMVQESVDEIVERVTEYARQIRGFKLV